MLLCVTCSENRVNMWERGIRKQADFSAELNALRQRLPLPSGNTIPTMAQQQQRQFLQQSRSRDPPPTTDLMLTSPLYAGCLNIAEIAQQSSRECATEYGTKEDALRALKRAQREFTEYTAEIDSYVYDEEKERRAKEGDVPRQVLNPNPFDFKQVAVPISPSPPQPPSSASASLFSASGKPSSLRSGRKHSDEPDPYDVASALRKVDAHAPRGRLTQGAVRKLSPPPSAPTLSATSNTKIILKLDKFRPVGQRIIVDEGRMRFCQSCHHVVLGSGSGDCPHCGVFIPEETDEAASGEDAGVGCNDSEVTASVLMGGAADIESIEKQEEEAFQKAVAEWREGRQKKEKRAQGVSELGLTSKYKPRIFLPPYFMTLWQQVQKQVENQ